MTLQLSMLAAAPGIPPGRFPNRWTVDEWDQLGPEQRRYALEVLPTLKRPGPFNSEKDKDGIEWAAWSWNPLNGCNHGCPYCYAREFTMQRPHGFPSGFEPVIIPGRLHAPRYMRVPQGAAANPALGNVFVCSMSDLYAKWVPQDWIDAILHEAIVSPHWRFLTLTKFPQRLAEQAWPENVWAGASVDRQARAGTAERSFANVRAGLRWLSCEPMLEPLRFDSLAMFDWIVIGGQSQQPIQGIPTYYPEPAAVDALVTQAQAAGCRVFVKSNTSKDGYRDWPRELPWKGVA